MGRHGKIAPITGAPERLRTIADERPRDDTADNKIIDELAGDPGEVEQAAEAKGLLVGGDLQHGVGRGVDDGLTARHVLETELGDDGRAGGMPVAEDPPEVRPRQRVLPGARGEDRAWFGDNTPNQR